MMTPDCARARLHVCSLHRLYLYVIHRVTHLGSTDVLAGIMQEPAIPVVPVAPSVTFLFHMCMGWKIIPEYVEQQVCGR